MYNINMNDDIVLSKIGKCENGIEISSVSDDITFLYKNKNWTLVDGFKHDAENVLDLIQNFQNTREFTFVVTDDEQHLVIVYRNHLSRINRNLIDRLLALVYSNYKASFSCSVIGNKVLNAYVTTKLFEALHMKHKENAADMTYEQLLLPDKFQPTLCDYQKKSVLWILGREVKKESFSDFYERLTAKDNETVVYKHLYSGLIKTKRPKDVIIPPGGILADEMGLGKTVEILALILLNPCTDVMISPAMQTIFSTLMGKRRIVEKTVFCFCNSSSMDNVVQCKKCCLWQHEKCVSFHDSEIEFETPYLCPSCWQHIIQEYGLLKTKATLIVTPNTIKTQWISEIKRHVQPTLRVFLYEGVLSGKWVNPCKLANYDIVLTDYNVLRGDFYFTQDNTSARTMRNKPRCMRVNTSIMMLNWWRVVLDEAQMVESNTAKLTALVKIIPTINRWAVTGTPIQKSLADLQPLLQFIGFEIVSNPSVWQQIVNEFILQYQQNLQKKLNLNSCAMVNILQKCMWRTSKTQVASELEIPPQQEVVHRIKFSNLEKLFYNEQHEECRNKFLENVFKYNRSMSTISPKVMNIILQPFLKIRLTCTIPVIIATHSASNFNSQQQKQFLQPKELHDYLKSANETSCKSALRLMASAHNGLAALYFLQQRFDEAIKNYEIVLKLANDYNDMNIGVDSLLQIHALHNIMQIKIINSGTIENLDSYRKKYNELEWKYLSPYASTLATAKTAYEAAIEKLNSDITENFMLTVANATITLLDNDQLSLIQKIQDECMQNFGKVNAKLSEIQSTRTLLFVVQLWFKKLRRILKTLQNDVINLSYFYENVRSRNQVSSLIRSHITKLVISVFDCHLSEIMNIQNSKKANLTQKKKNLCKLCCIRNSINEFECLLFDKIIDKNTNYAEGVENPSFEMYLCKLTLQFIKNKNRILNTNMENNWLYLENLQLVCKRLIKFWIEMEYTIKAYDELNMCKMRITLTADADDKSIFKVRRNEIPGRIIEHQSELMSAQNQFTNQMARLRYIKHLKDYDPGPCPICHLKEDDRYAVLECGHHICFPCLKLIRSHLKGNHIKCSICRNIQQNTKIFYVCREKVNELINGRYSSKITYIVSLILRLQSQHNEEYESSRTAFELNLKKDVLKILIFSQWQPILQAIALALQENDIKYRAQCTPKTIEEFKDPQLGVTCLLMPFVKGSKGLNLVEATHVFLVEPVLNPGEELQAVGRVHRIGQKRHTTVHRFIVTQTIEENIYNFIVSSSSKSDDTNGIQRNWEFDNLSLTDFENLFSLQQTGECKEIGLH